MLGGGGGPSTDTTKLARLARIPRLYRLIRILRMVKMLRVFRKSSEFRDWIESFDFNAGLLRMLKVMTLTFFLIHIMTCFWYLAATFEENLYRTWVGERGIVDSSQMYKYLNSFYWAFQTITTVGYGDFVISTPLEHVFAIFWMMIGVNFYAFTIANVSSIIASLDS
jgi:hypothetical protein